MKLNRDNIYSKYPWLIKKNCKFIISSDYDGLICASFLSHYLNWDLTGYYDYKSIWLSQEAINNKKNLIWVDLNILPKDGKSLGTHIVNINNENPKGLITSCNPNVLTKLNQNNFKNKFPFSTLLFLMWLNNIKIKNNDIAKLLVLHADNTWMKIQKYHSNTEKWKNVLNDYPWDILFNNIDSIIFEKKVDQFLYPKLIDIGASTGFSKLSSLHLNIKSRECKINPDWDYDVIQKLFNMFSEILGWTPPKMPLISKKIYGSKHKIDVAKINKIGLNKYIIKNNIFSYALTSPKTFSYTVFNKIQSK